VSDPRLSAEDLSAAVRVHADRVHDFLRRLGCAPVAAIEVLETSALDLVDAAARSRREVTDVVGWWFGRARALGVRVAGGDAGLPLGGGLLSADSDQARVAEALEGLPERERVAVLLRDSYALPAASVGVVLATEADAAMETVGRGRLRFLQAVGDDLPTTAGHPVDLGALARLGTAGPVAARDATPRKHAQSCAICRGIWDAQERAHRLLAGLTVVALPDSERDAVLGRVEAAAYAALPSAAALLLDDPDDDELADDDDRPSRLLAPLYAFVGIVLAVILGTAIGILVSRDDNPRTSSAPPDTDDESVLPPVTAAPLPSAPPVPTTTPTATAVPTTRVFTIAPTPSASQGGPPTPTTSPSPEPASDPLTLAADPPRGPNGQTLTVQGGGWTPGAVVVLEYVDPLGRPTGSRAQQTIDARGRFTTTLSAQDPANLPGRHTIRGSDGSNSATTTYDVSG
jgi:DNA-directed RNA polymerase specialized sigma24 family protein